MRRVLCDRSGVVRMVPRIKRNRCVWVVERYDSYYYRYDILAHFTTKFKAKEYMKRYVNGWDGEDYRVSQVEVK